MRDGKWPTGFAMRSFYEQAPEELLKMAIWLGGQSCASKGLTKEIIQLKVPGEHACRVKARRAMRPCDSSTRGEDFYSQ